MGSHEMVVYYQDMIDKSMDVQRMDIQRLPSFEVMIVTAT